MIFVNAQIENGTLDGYIIYFPANKGSSVQLLKASQVNAAAMSATSTVTSFSGVSRGGVSSRVQYELHQQQNPHRNGGSTPPCGY